MKKHLQNPRRAPRTLPYLQLSRCPGCPVCGALPFELCRNIPGDPQTATRWVHQARLLRLKRRASWYARIARRARERLERRGALKAA